jgi:hypothetical protein
MSCMLGRVGMGEMVRDSLMIKVLWGLEEDVMLTTFLWALLFLLKR